MIGKYGDLPWYIYSDKITKVDIINEIKPIYTSCWFLGMKNLTEIKGLNNLDTSNTIRMDGMFEGCENIEELDLSNFDTSKVTTMCSMFRNTRKLRNLNLSSFNTTNVTDMSSMFKNCSNER